MLPLMFALVPIETMVPAADAELADVMLPPTELLLLKTMVRPLWMLPENVAEPVVFTRL